MRWILQPQPGLSPIILHGKDHMDAERLVGNRYELEQLCSDAAFFHDEYPGAFQCRKAKQVNLRLLEALRLLAGYLADKE